MNRKFQRNQTKHYLPSYLKLVLADKDWVSKSQGAAGLSPKADALGVVVRSRFQQNSEMRELLCSMQLESTRTTKIILLALKLVEKLSRIRKSLKLRYSISMGPFSMDIMMQTWWSQECNLFQSVRVGGIR